MGQKDFAKTGKGFCSKDFDGDIALKDRQNMFTSGPFRLGSAVPAVNKLAGISAPSDRPSPPWESDPMLDRENEVFRTTRALAHFRRSCPVLTEGAMVFREAEDSPGGFFAYSRIPNMTYTGEFVLDIQKSGLPEIVVLMNPHSVEKKVATIMVDERMNPTD